MQPELYPLKFESIYKDKIWGGRKFSEILGRSLPEGLIGESWDVAAHNHGASIVSNGDLKGKTLVELVDLYGEELLGHKGINPQSKFPLLLKLIDANDDLSVQVHPDDIYVAKHGIEAWGKAEMWYVVHAEPEAWIIWGLREGVTKEEMSKALECGGEAVLDCLNKVYVKPGEVYPISAGLVHALGAGVVVFEVQQNSDTTFRFYDWDRLDDQGRPRDLHLEQALEVTDFSANHKDPAYQFSRCEKYFKLNILEQPKNFSMDLDDSFAILTVFRGKAEVTVNGVVTEMESGQSLLVPACLGTCAVSSNGIVLSSSLP